MPSVIGKLAKPILPGFQRLQQEHRGVTATDGHSFACIGMWANAGKKFDFARPEFVPGETMITVMAEHRPILTDAEYSDIDLVGHFVASGDEQAFARLVERHSGLVMGVCRRILSDREDAEDAFQATFLVLARKASRIRKRASVSSWLHGVAFRVALRMSRKRYHRREASLDEPIRLDDSPFENVARRHQMRVVDEELNQLPERDRELLVLFFLEGQTVPQIAKRMGLSVSALEGRLRRGKKRLGERLARRGCALTVAGGLLLATRQASAAAVPDVLLNQTIEQGIAATASLGGHGLSQALAREEVIQMSLLGKKAALTWTVCTALFVAGATGLAPIVFKNEAVAGGQTEGILLEVADDEGETGEVVLSTAGTQAPSIAGGVGAAETELASGSGREVEIENLQTQRRNVEGSGAGLVRDRKMFLKTAQVAARLLVGQGRGLEGRQGRVASGGTGQYPAECDPRMHPCLLGIHFRLPGKQSRKSKPL